MKKVVSKDELKNKMNIAIDLLCDTVKTTLGPKGSNVIIDHSAFSPFITNDGVTIADNIESEDEVVNTILNLAKEASIKTNDIVGDGTTTTLVLLQNIFKNGMHKIDEGINPIILKNELNVTLEKSVKMIKEYSWKASEEEILNIASISANSYEIGKIISDAYCKVKNKSAIKITEGKKDYTEVIYKSGYIIETLMASSYFFKDKDNIEIKNSNILLINNYLNDIEEVSNILNDIILQNKPLVIIADDYSDKFISDVVSLYLDNVINIYLLKIPGYGLEKVNILQDIALITNAKIIDNNEIKVIDLGNINTLTINKEETIFSFQKNNQILNKIIELKQLESNDINSKRIAMFENFLIEIKVGALTDVERREKKMRFVDALCAVFGALNGVVLGSGLTLYKVSEEMIVKSIGDEIISLALKSPFEQIMFNSGLSQEEIITEIKNSEYRKIYNINKDCFELIDNTSVIDPLDVVLNSLKNAVSIASMLLTTTSLVINEYQNNIGKSNDYNEL